MDNKFFPDRHDFKNCFDCKHYGDDTCQLFNVHNLSEHNMDRHHFCVFYETKAG